MAGCPSPFGSTALLPPEPLPKALWYMTDGDHDIIVKFDMAMDVTRLPGANDFTFKWDGGSTNTVIFSGFFALDELTLSFLDVISGKPNPFVDYAALGPRLRTPVGLEVEDFTDLVAS